MSSVQERLQMKREPIDNWSIREQLCLASAVARSGDQNWMSVSRALKPFGEPNRPPDWFHQKNCAAQYGMLLAMVETPKRKKRVTSVDNNIETPIDNILKKLQAERLNELKKLLNEEKAEYQKLQEDMVLLQSGQVTEEQLDIWCKEIDEEEYKKEQESLAHAQWLKEREQQKQEIEKAWKPNKLPVALGQKRKNSDSIDTLLETEHFEEIQQQLQQQHMQHHQLQIQQNQQSQELSKPALSPLLTSLLKSPSQVQSPSILHTAITNRHVANTNTNPMIASLLNSTTAVPVSPGIQQLVSTAIGQNQESTNTIGQNNPIGNDILDDAQLTNIKLDDLANSILVQDGPLPEIKKEEVDDIISEIIENAGDIVDDPEQHLQLDGNGDININLELSDFDEEEIIQETESVPKEYNKDDSLETTKTLEEKVINQQTSQQQSPHQVVDPFEFQEDPIVFDPPSKPSGSIVKQDPNYVPHYHQQQQQNLQLSQNQSADSTLPQQQVFEMEGVVVEEVKEVKQEEIVSEKFKDSQDDSEDTKKSKESPSEGPSRIEKTRGSVEIVEVTLTEDEESEKELNKSQIEDIVHSSKQSTHTESHILEKEIETVEIGEEKPDLATKLEPSEDDTEEKSKTEPSEEETTTTTWTTTTESKESVSTTEEISEISDTTSDIKKEFNMNLEGEQQSSEPTSVTPEYSEELFNEMNIEIKMDITSGVKRDYSRTKKKEDKDFDVLLAIEKSQLDDSEITEDTFSDTITDIERKDVKQKIKSETERSSSPWTEEEDNANRSSKRRYSTPATPVDSVPNSPASSNAFYEDDREYKNWKKSVMLVYNRLATNRYASLFLKPITEDQAPGYSSVVYRPMDLQTIKKNIENGTIRTTLEFKRDVMLMFTNAIMYNKTNDFVYNMALQMQQESLQPIEILLQAQQGEGSLRRETRTSESGMKRKRTFTDELLKVKKKKDD